MSEPALTQTHEGITISLDQCIADEHSAYISFRISGWKLKEGDEPRFDQASCRMGLTGAQGTSGNFLSVWSAENQTECFTDENGDLFYCFTVSAIDDTLPGRDVHVEFRNLGHYREGQTIIIDVDMVETWTFDWALTGTTEKRVWKDLSLPIGESEWVLREVVFSPVTAVFLLSSPQGVENDDLDGQPWFLGIIDKDGTEHRLPGGGGCSVIQQEDQTLFKAVESFHKVIDVSSVCSVLFVFPEEDAICQVNLPDTGE